MHMADRALLAADLFITRVVRTAWASANAPGDPHEPSIRVPRCPARCRAIVTQLGTQAARGGLSAWEVCGAVEASPADW